MVAFHKQIAFDIDKGHYCGVAALHNVKSDLKKLQHNLFSYLVPTYFSVNVHLDIGTALFVEDKAK